MEGNVEERRKAVVRPSSASANLQTHEAYKTSLYNNKKRPTTAAPVGSRPKTGVPKAHHWHDESEDSDLQKIRLERRPTLCTLEGLDEDDVPRQAPTQGSAGDLLKSKIEEKINIDTLELLKEAFQEADEDGSGELDLDEFKLLLKSKLNLSGAKDQQIDALFYKIDWSSDGNITWDEFCTYMQLEYAEKEDSYQRSKDVSFQLPAKTANTPHRDTVLRITDSEGTFIACSQEGLVSFWDSNMRLKRHKTVVPSETIKPNKPKWVTDFAIMTQFNKIIVGTGDREIQFFELSSFEPYCQISLLHSTPLRMDYCALGQDECLILYGDTAGNVNILILKNTGECLRLWKKRPKQHEIATISLEKAIESEGVSFICWKVHNDWLQELKYFPEIHQVISCSNNSNTALVIGCVDGSTSVPGALKDGGLTPRPDLPSTKINGGPPSAKHAPIKQTPSGVVPRTRLESDQSVFKVYKGVKTFAFSKSKNILVTGGMDRLVRMWNPYVSSKPTAVLRGHNAPIFYLFIAEEENRVFSMSTEKCVKIWDIQDQNCLLTVRPKSHKIRGDMQACHYSNTAKALMTATDQISLLAIKVKPTMHADIVITHKEPVACTKYNPAFKQVITCSEASVVKIWDYETGNHIFDFNDAHGEYAITCMDFDTFGRRLITGGRDGNIKVWNYNNGHCLMTMFNGIGHQEICSLVYVEINKNRYVVGVGWDRNVNIYADEPNDTGLHQVMSPQEQWEDDKKNGHKEDILSITYCPPNLLATSSYDGEVVVWNMISGHIFCHLHSPDDPDYVSESSDKLLKVDGDRSINQIIFLKKRSYHKDSASLVASGPRGYLHFWNVFHGGRLFAKFRGPKIAGALITCLCVNNGCNVLYSADSYGFVTCWDVGEYCMNGSEPNPPDVIASWRAHVESVCTVDFVEENAFVITSSTDCSVRLWSKIGEYVGTFGQPEPWDIYSPTTWQHPMAPFDVLVDPNSLPVHPVISKKETISDIINEGSEKSKEEKEWARQAAARLQQARQQFHVDDEEIAARVKELSARFVDESGEIHVGKRLRHERAVPPKTDRGGPSYHQQLVIKNLIEPPTLAEPALLKAKDTEGDAEWAAAMLAMR